MKSQTSQVARSCRIREWAAMVQECPESSKWHVRRRMVIGQITSPRRITIIALRKVRKACLDSIPSDSVEHEIYSSPYGTYAYGISFDSS